MTIRIFGVIIYILFNGIFAPNLDIKIKIFKLSDNKNCTMGESNIRQIKPKNIIGATIKLANMLSNILNTANVL